MTGKIIYDDCYAGSYGDEYKGDTVIRCGDCDKILFRDIAQP